MGEPLARSPRSGDAERGRCRLGAEVEMWLAAHPLNRGREARQLPPLNSLWFWGGTRASGVAGRWRKGAAVPCCSAGAPDAWLAGLAAHCGVPLHAR